MAAQCLSTVVEESREGDLSESCRRNQNVSSADNCPPTADLYTSLNIQEALDEIEEEGQFDENEMSAVEEYLEVEQKTKYLFDGWNMIKITQPKSATLRALTGKALLIRKKLRDRLNNVQKVDVLANLGNIACHIQPGLKIPPLLYHCITEIECRDPVEGIYATDGCSTTVRRIMKKFVKGKIPNLQDVDAHVLATCIKRFLGGLADPIIPRCARHDFLNSLTHPDKLIRLLGLIMKLPEVNKNSLLFLIQHLYGIVLRCQYKISRMDLAQIFAPLLLGESLPENDCAEIGPMLKTTYAILSFKSLPYKVQ